MNQRVPLWKQAVANYSPEGEWIDISSGIQRKINSVTLNLYDNGTIRLQGEGHKDFLKKNYTRSKRQLRK